MIRKIVILKPKKSLNFSESINAGVKEGSNDKIFVANDDIIISKQTIERLEEKCDEDTITGPDSNCNLGWLTDYSYSVSNKENISLNLVPSMTLDNVKNHISEIHSIVPKRNDVKELDWLAFFATMIHRDTFVKDVGYMDENFVYDKEDLDWCVRAKQKGKKFLYCYDSYCFHFGGVSRKRKHQELGLKHDLDTEHNELYYQQKYNIKNKPVIGFYCFDAWEYWDENSLNGSVQDGKPKGIGGSETQAVLMCRELSNLGYKVKIFNKCKENHMDSGGYDVEYIPFQDFPKYSEKFEYDHFIASRYLDCFNYSFKSKQNIAMIHDVFLIMNGRDQKDVHLDKIDKYFCLSHRHAQFVSEYHSIPMEKIVVTSNGLDFSRFENKNIERNPYKLIYSSSPDRGLERLLDLFPRLNEKAELHIYYGFENFRDQKYVKRMMGKIDNLNANKTRIFYHGRVGQDQLAEEFMSSSIWAYPTWFEETYCCLPGTKIEIENNEKNIEDILEGDTVKTHQGRFRKVEKVMNKYVFDHIKNIKLGYLKNNLRVTKEHPILAVKRNNRKFDDLKKCLGKTVIPEWTSSENLEEGDFVLYPINKLNEDTDYFHMYSSSILKEGKLYNPKTRANKLVDFKITEDFLELCGWFVSEGCFDGKTNITFSLNIDEKEEAEFIKNQLKNLDLKYWESTRVEDSTRSISTSSVILGRFFEENFGKLAKNKNIPSWVKNLKNNYLERFLKGVFKGDGCVDRNNFVYECASEKLIQDIYECLLKFSVVASTSIISKNKIYRDGSKILRKENEKLSAWRLHCSMNQNFKLFESFGFNFEIKTTGNYQYLIDENYIYLPIRKITSEFYAGKVYNFEVEEDHSYIADGVIVHNCITALEAMAGGCVVLSSDYWGLSDTVKDGGILLPMNDDRNTVFSKVYEDTWVSECNHLLLDSDYREYWRKKGFERVRRFTWSNVAAQWDRYFKKGEWINIQ